MNRLATVFAVLFALGTGCAEQAVRREIRIGEKTVSYVMQKCKPAIKWDGMSLVLEGLSVPGQGNLAFSVGKIDYSEKAIREIKSTALYYDGLLVATCQTLVRLDGQEAIERYSKHRDNLLSDLATTLQGLEKAESEAEAERLAQQGQERGAKTEGEFQKKIK